MHKLTKISVKESAEKSNNDLEKINDKIADNLLKLPGYLSGGTFAVTVGMSFTGILHQSPEVGQSIKLTGSEWFVSSPVEEIIPGENGSQYIKTRNSLYLLEEL